MTFETYVDLLNQSEAVPVENPQELIKRMATALREVLHKNLDHEEDLLEWELGMPQAGLEHDLHLAETELDAAKGATMKAQGEVNRLLAVIKLKDQQLADALTKLTSEAYKTDL